MKTILKIIILSLLFNGGFISSSAQYLCSEKKPIASKDNLPFPSVNWDKSSAKRIFHYKSYLLPAAFIVYGVLALHTDAFQDVNETIRQKIYIDGSHHKTKIDNYLQYSPAAAVYALNLAGIHGADNFRDRTIIYSMSNIMLGIVVTATKKLNQETRPDGSDNLSFPSGHTATAFAAAEFMRIEYKDISVLYGIAGYAAAAATGYLRLYNDKHWMGDVVAGAGMGIISTKLSYWIYPAIKRKLFKNKQVIAMVVPSYQNGAFGLAFSKYF